ncbi:MAG: helix-turn-helix domain-containing protein [Clostridium sp.]|nr:helix-turn-helix domain-containing protein [Clostridium sp.]
MKISYNSEPRKNLIGPAICRLRKEHHLSQRALAAKLQILGYDFSELTILRIEKGIRLVTDIELKILCQFFHVTPNELLGFDHQ